MIMLTDEECPFCVVEEDGRSPIWTQLMGDDSTSDVLLETENFVVVLDTAPLVIGHTLIVTRRHIGSMASSGVSVREELLALKSRVVKAVESAFGPTTRFEHGAAGARRAAGACVDHAHLHVVPGIYDLRPSIAKDFSSIRSFGGYREALAEFDGLPYLVVEVDNGGTVGTEAQACTTQYLRRLVAISANANERWNWRDCIRWHSALGLKSDLLEARSVLRRQLG